MSTNLEEIRMMERDVMRREIKIEDPSTCFYCNSKGLTPENKFCPNCRFPQGGTELEMKNFYIGTAKKKFMIRDSMKKVNRAKYILFALAGLNFLVSLYYLFYTFENAVLAFGIQLFVALVYLGLGLWCIKKPLLGIIVGLSFYLFIIALMAVIDPMTIIQGILWKVLIVMAFIYGIQSVKEAEKMEAELEKLKVANDFTKLQISAEVEEEMVPTPDAEKLEDQEIVEQKEEPKQNENE